MYLKIHIKKKTINQITMPRKQKSKMKALFESKDETYKLHNYVPYWYSDMSEEERREYSEKLPRTFASDNVPYNYEKEAKNKGWQLHTENQEVYYTHPKYNGERFNAIHFKPHNTSKEYYQYIPYVPRNKDVLGLGYILVSNSDGTYCKVKSNEWTELFDTRRGQRILKKRYMREKNKTK